MLLKLLGAIDLMTGISVVLVKFDINIFATLFLVIFAIKSVIFITNPASWIDIIALIIFVLVIFGVFNIITWLAVIWVLQKGIVSLVV
ncbi:MAG: hypothetical protein AABW49_03895 [Nanoarchaeota archaeon]